VRRDSLKSLEHEIRQGDSGSGGAGPKDGMDVIGHLSNLDRLHPVDGSNLGVSHAIDTQFDGTILVAVTSLAAPSEPLRASLGHLRSFPDLDYLGAKR
jgi:hypothetical protein